MCVQVDVCFVGMCVQRVQASHICFSGASYPVLLFGLVFWFFFKRGTYSYSGMKVAKQAKLWPSEIQRSIVLLLRLQTPRHLAQAFKRVLGTGLRSSCLHSKT
jgi:ABC-type polysaccharide/polyol phosphate export permease